MTDKQKNTRRKFLKTAGLATTGAVVVGLAACSDDGSTELK
ncbi:MAG: twin-arginine translocation signal domain-containing protein, partial [Gammaproteobacteria bacterium]